MLRRVACLILCFATPALAEEPQLHLGSWTFAPEAQVRVRGEYRYQPPEAGGRDFLGGQNPQQRHAGGALSRIRIGAGADNGAVALKVTLQDARVLGAPGDAPILGATGGAFGAYEGYLEVHESDDHPSFVRLGRQAVQWGDGRLVSRADWSPMGRSLDALTARWDLKAVRLEGLAALLDAPRPFGVQAGDTQAFGTSGAQLFGLHGDVFLEKWLNFEATALVRIARSSGLGDGSNFALARRSGELATGALAVHGDLDPITYRAMGAYQFGNAQSLGLLGRDVSAWMAALDLQYKAADVVFSPTFSVGSSFASGDDGQGAYKQFDPVLPDVHSHHGLADVFSDSNSWHSYASVSGEPIEGLRAKLAYRYARLAENKGEWIGTYLSATGNGAKSAELGHEVDVSLYTKLWNALDLCASYSLLAWGDGAREILSNMQRGPQRADGTFGSPTVSHVWLLQAYVRAF